MRGFRPPVRRCQRGTRISKRCEPRIVCGRLKSKCTGCARAVHPCADVPRRIGCKPGPLGPFGNSPAERTRSDRRAQELLIELSRCRPGGPPDPRRPPCPCCRPPVPRIAVNNDAASQAMAVKRSCPPEVDVLHRQQTLPVAAVAIYQSIRHRPDNTILARSLKRDF
jgi:hypothetical protein